MSSVTESTFDTLQEVLANRYSCRAYQPEPVPRKIIEQMLLAAQRTASSCNTQPWRVHIVSGGARDQLAEQLYAEARDHPREAGDFDFPVRFVNEFRERRYTCGMQLYDSLGIARDDKAARMQQMLENYRFFGAPHVALIFNEADLGAYGVVDCGAYVTNFMNAATALGLGTVPQAAIACYPHIVKPFVQAPDHHQLLCAVSFGWPNHHHPINQFRTQRAELASVAQFHD